jgi:hypothetical protein
MNRNTGMHAGQVIGWMNGLQVVGMDIAKSVFQIYTADMKTGELRDKRLKRDKVLEYFRLMAPAVVAMEACGGAHHWARQRRPRRDAAFDQAQSSLQGRIVARARLPLFLIRALTQGMASSGMS